MTFLKKIMSHPILSYLKENFCKEKNDSLNFILHLRGSAVVFIFYLNRKPIAVAKLSRDNFSELIQEYENLKKLHHLFRGFEIEKTIEEPLGLINLGEPVLLKKYIEGIPGDIYLAKGKEKAIKCLNLAVDWLINFLNNLKSYRTNSKDEKIKIAKKFYQGGLPSYFKLWIENKSFFISPTVGDLIIRNFLVEDDGIKGVIDFATFEMKGIPEADLIGLMVSSATSIFGLNEKAIKNTFFCKNWFSSEVKNLFQKYCQFFKINFKDFLEILPIYSDRAISIATKQKDKKLIEFHSMLKDNFIKKQKQIFQEI